MSLHAMHKHHHNIISNKQWLSADVYINVAVMVQYSTGLMSFPEQERVRFAQETVKAEAWLKAKEPLITTSKEPEGGEAQAQTDEVEQLILRHEAFRKAAVTWKERFSSLRQLSSVSLIVVQFNQFGQITIQLWNWKEKNYQGRRSLHHYWLTSVL